MAKATRAIVNTLDLVTGSKMHALKPAFARWSIVLVMLALAFWVFAAGAGLVWFGIGIGLAAIASTAAGALSSGLDVARVWKAWGRMSRYPIAVLAIVALGGVLPYLQIVAGSWLASVLPETASFLSLYRGQSALVAVLATVIFSVTASQLFTRGTAARAELAEELAPALAKVFQVPLTVWQTSAGTSRVGKGNDYQIHVNPMPAGVNLIGAAGRLSRELPQWALDETASNSQQVVLVQIANRPEEAARRSALAQSDGLIVAFHELESTPSRPSHGVWLLAPEVNAGPAQASYLNAFARKIDPDLTVVQHAGFHHETYVARLDPRVRALRDRIAALINCQPWDVEIVVEFNREQQPVSLDIVRAPELLDRAKRRALWMSVVQTAVPIVPDTLWRLEDRPSDGRVTLRRITDPLKDLVTIGDFNSRFPNPNHNPAESWRSFPFAVREDGSAIDYTMFHTLGVGQTGAGKGSIWWSIFNGVSDSARAGLVQCFAIDPKGAEAIGEDGHPLGVFEKVATTADEWADLVEELVADMNARKGRGRKPAVTTEFPLRILLIDELSALSKLDTDKKRASEVMAGLLAIASQGRSLNVLLVGLVQAPQKDMVGDLRDFLPMRVALRTGTKLETDIVLGEGATDSGAEAHLIPIATPGNGYASAGVGFAKVEGDPEPVRIRLPYTDDAQIEAWSVEFAALRAKRTGQPDVAPSSVDQVETVTIADFEFDIGDLEDPEPLLPAPVPLDQPDFWSTDRA